MQGRLWEYKGFFLSGSLFSHSSSGAAESSSASEDLENTGIESFLEEWTSPNGVDFSESEGFGVEYFGKFEEGIEKQMNLETEKMVDIFRLKSLQLWTL